MFAACRKAGMIVDGYGRTRPPCVLVVDDDIGIRRGLRVRLESFGYRANTACNGAQAIGIVNQGTTDVVLLDVKMPGMDGFEVCETIKRTHDLPIIFLTGAEDPIVRRYLPEMSSAVGGDCFLRKPFETRVVLSLVARVLDGSVH